MWLRRWQRWRRPDSGKVGQWAAASRQQPVCGSVPPLGSTALPGGPMREMLTAVANKSAFSPFRASCALGNGESDLATQLVVNSSQPTRHQLDRRRDQVVLQAGVALGRTATSGFAECRARGCDCGRQDRGVTTVGFQSVPVGRSSGCVFEGGSRCRKGAEGGAGGMRQP